MSHVLILTLGPVQDFIETARRTRDLWFGSWLLSELSKATAEAIARVIGVEALVFPGVAQLSDLGPATSTLVTNKIVVRVPNGRDPVALAKLGEDGLRRRLRRLRDDAFDEIRPIEPHHFDRPTAQAQVDDLIELAWVSAPETGDGSYAAARRRAESLLAGRKHTRLWNPVAWAKDVPKSSMDGERESVLHEDLFDRVGTKDGPSVDEVRRRYGVAKTERLCGVGLFKRHGTRPNAVYTHRFLSTGHLAAWPLYERVKKAPDAELQQAWEKYLRTLADGGINLAEQEIVQGPGWRMPVFGRMDGSLLFEGRLPDLFEEVTDAGKAKEGLHRARRALAEFLKKLGVSTPLPYYAILVADGDRMGKAIERQDSFEKHRNLSRELARFAGSVRTIVERDFGGELVYSGGDDVLAFVPLHRVVCCARELAESFKQHLSGFPVNEQGEPPTLSAGIGISHFMDPLRGALDLAREAEKLAKRERNSLGIIVDKRSGSRVEVVGVWGTLDRRLDDYVELHRQDKVPDGAAYELRELGRLLTGTEGAERETLEKIVRKEAERILRRKQPAHGEEPEIETGVLDRLLKDLDAVPLAAVADRLIVARLLAQAADEAEPAKPQTPGDKP
jgi:CRISPR-associated protein Cmr2